MIIKFYIYYILHYKNFDDYWPNKSHSNDLNPSIIHITGGFCDKNGPSVILASVMLLGEFSLSSVWGDLRKQY